MAKGDSKLRNRKNLERIVPNNAISEQAFLNMHGVGSELPGIAFDYKSIRVTSDRGENRLLKQINNRFDKYINKRNKYKKIYKEQLLKGNIKNPTTFQSALVKAQGNSDNESVRAARRIVKKYGYDWKTGNKLN